MKMAIVAANGKAGKLIAAEAVNRGIDVTAIVREENKSAAQSALVKDALTLTRDDLAAFDVVVSAVGGWTADTIGAIPATVKHLAEILTETQTRLLVVGGAGSLFVNPEHTATVADDPAFPADWKPCRAPCHDWTQVDLRKPSLRLSRRRAAHGRVQAWRRGADDEFQGQQRRRICRLCRCDD